MADVLNKDLFVSYSGDASAMGAIYLAMLVTGKIESWNDVKKLVSIDETYHPRPALSERYRRSFNIYEHLYEKLKADFTAIDSWPDPDAAMGK
jgi:gluconokinase